jgi:hypothetical protein
MNYVTYFHNIWIYLDSHINTYLDNMGNLIHLIIFGYYVSIYLALIHLIVPI